MFSSAKSLKNIETYRKFRLMNMKHLMRTCLKKPLNLLNPIFMNDIFELKLSDNECTEIINN